MREIFTALTLAFVSLTPRADAIDDYVRGYLERSHTPGLAIGIVQDGVLVRAQGYGFANLDHHVPVHADTVFQSGSIGKMFTATAIMLMVEDGKLKLDEPIRTYLPDAPAAWAPIKVRNLLTHTAGLSHGVDFDLRKDYSDDELLKICYGDMPQFTPGDRMSYSNTGYIVLGLLVKKVGGKSYNEVLEERVFTPLGMNTAGGIDDAGIVPNRAAGYQLTEDGKIVNQDWVAPTGNSTGDGSLYLTVLDFAKWEAAVRERKVLKPESWAEMLKPVVLNDGKTYPYGFGWFLDRFAGHPAQHHSGSWQGFVTEYVRYLETGTAVIALLNLREGSPGEVAKNVAALANPRLALRPGTPIKDVDSEVTARLRGILLEQDIPAKARAAFAPSDSMERTWDSYRKQRQPFGKLQELALFDFEAKGDDRYFRYRARFDNGFATALLTVSPRGMERLTLRPAASWQATVF